MRIIALFFILLHCSVLQAKPLLVGIPPFIPPFAMEVDGKNQYIGFDVDLINEICRRIDRQCQLQAYNFDQVLIAVIKGEIDLGIGDITITAERSDQYIFSLPYMESNAQYVSLKANNINFPAEIKGKNVGVHHPELFEAVVLRQFGDDVKIKTYPYIADMIVALTAGDVDVIIMDAAAAESLYANNNNLVLVGDKTPLGLGYGIIAGKENSDLMFKINKALMAMETDGTYLTIYNIYFGDMKY